MIPADLADLAALIYPEWTDLDEVDYRDLLAAAQRILDAGWVCNKPRGSSAGESPVG